MEGKYVEKLKSGGQLIARLRDWEIEYYFPGPDLRYNGEFVRIPGTNIDKFILAWKNNFLRYQELKSSFGLQGTYSEKGQMGMYINIRGLHDGVCIDKYHLPIRTEDALKQIIGDYEYAKEKAHSFQSGQPCTVAPLEDSFTSFSNKRAAKANLVYNLKKGKDVFALQKIMHFSIEELESVLLELKAKGEIESYDLSIKWTEE